MLLNQWILIDFTNSPESPIYPEFPSIPQNSPESTGCQVVRQILSMMSENFAKQASAVVGSNVEDTWLDMFRPVWTSLDLIKILWILKWTGNYCLWCQKILWILLPNLPNWLQLLWEAMLKILDWFPRIPQNISRIPQNSQGFPRIPQSSPKFQNISQNSPESTG